MHKWLQFHSEAKMHIIPVADFVKSASHTHSLELGTNGKDNNGNESIFRLDLGVQWIGVSHDMT